ncbi:MAG: bifunctional diaminohydroxyphosphoribosylaminopyrimidine deaminase/5-amino-6-(5-phosphoribosylamino)uracil reductase RibD [Nitrospiraceae bacterium]|nr:bifunctional diaminohydroxyphosphoribosylaminopyrimidine deaminase/5-amino-6-(5-phosphoribosylamino)uracil reductase RibD [Nitrospiraceae bacterium]
MPSEKSGKKADEAYMRQALALALKGWGNTSPNPMVGAVIVKAGKVIAKGFHRKAGLPHAEAVAIGNAGQKARGATLYVTLEPCCHLNKRTPPCTGAVIRAGLKRVVAAMPDPNPLVAGCGISELRKAGIEVKTGVLEEKARALNEAYIKYITTKRPFVILKSAMSLDGKIATKTGESKWLTGEKARGLVHRVRSGVDAIMTAVGTVKADNPELTARIKGGKTPIRIIIDPEMLSPEDSKVFLVPPETIIVSRKPLSKSLEGKGVGIINFEGRLSLAWLMEKLGSMGITSLLIEGGSSLNAHAIEEGVVDKMMLFYAPLVIGGKDAFPSIGGRGVEKLIEACRLENLSVRKIGEDVLIEGYTLPTGEKPSGRAIHSLRPGGPG